MVTSTGQLDSPGSSVLGVPLRSNAILMGREREAQYQNLKSRQDLLADCERPYDQYGMRLHILSLGKAGFRLCSAGIDQPKN